LKEGFVTENVTIELWELEEELTMLILCQGITDVRITEQLKNQSTNTYTVKGLEMELVDDDKMVIFTDVDNYILGNITFLSGFLVDCLLYITRWRDNHKKVCCYELRTEYGHVSIEIL